VATELQDGAKYALRFLRQSLSDPLNVGAILPSSRLLAREMVRDLRFGERDVVLELGPGTGALTVEIRRHMVEGCRYLGIERDSGFVELLASRFPGLEFAAGCAEDADVICRGQGIDAASSVISGLPFATMKPAAQDAILASLTSVLRPGSVFRTFQYVHAYALPSAVRFRQQMALRFGRHERSEAHLANFPPAYVLTWVA
jgi:phosphatidylethanolamine/phosphatidyl-N-methylethanolamine N-methyltransferase